MALPTDSDEIRAARSLVCEIGRRLWARNMVAANDGNVSIRVGDEVVCTPTGVSKGFMDEATLPVVSLDGRQLEGDHASSEIKMHLRVYAEDDSVRAVVHAHPMFATMWAITGQPLRATMLPESVVTMPWIPIAKYGTPSTDAVPDSVAPFVRDYHACLLEHHGALTWSADPIAAYLAMERLEYTAQITWRLRQAGMIRELPPDELARLREIFHGPVIELPARGLS